MSIIVATDLSECSAQALRAAAVLAAAQNAQLIVVHVVEELDAQSGWLILVETPAELEAQVLSEARVKVEALVSQTLGAQAASEVVIVLRVGHAVDELLEEADKRLASCIACGTQGHSELMAALLGSTANQLIRESPIPILIVPATQHAFALHRILAPVHVQEDQGWLRTTASLAHAHGARVTLLHAVGLPVSSVDPLFPTINIPENVHQLRAQQREAIDRIATAAGLDDVVDQRLIEVGRPEALIADAARQVNADLICMGTHSRRGVRRFFIGNTAERILRDLPCAVYVVPEQT